MAEDHPLDRATTLTRVAEGRYVARTSEDYSNFGGPFGGFTAAILMRAVMEDARRHGTPVALTVNYCAAIADGPFEVHAQERRTGKSTQHWSLDLVQNDKVAATASVVCGPRRPVWTHHPAKPPNAPAAASVPLFDTSSRTGWLRCYELRFLKGEVDFQPRDPTDLREPLSMLWMRDHPARPLDFVSLAALSDAFIIRAFVVRSVFVPVGIVTLTTYFHTGDEELRAQGSDPILGLATAHTFSNGFADQTAQLWGKDDRLLATSMQIVWYRE